jgi:hypothetical protein
MSSNIMFLISGAVMLNPLEKGKTTDFLDVEPHKTTLRNIPEISNLQA